MVPAALLVGHKVVGPKDGAVLFSDKDLVRGIEPIGQNASLIEIARNGVGFPGRQDRRDNGENLRGIGLSGVADADRHLWSLWIRAVTRIALGHTPAPSALAHGVLGPSLPSKAPPALWIAGQPFSHRLQGVRS